MTPKFQPEQLELRRVGTSLMLPAYLECEACGERALRDVATKLCRACWRAWRWSAEGIDVAADVEQVEARVRTGGPLP